MIHHKSAYLLLCLLCTSLSAATTGNSASTDQSESSFNTVGIRVGVEAYTKVSLTSYELYETSDPQRSWDLGEKGSTAIGYEAAVGALAGEGEVAAYVHFGFTLEFAHEALPISLVLATGPSLYSEDTFEGYDMGGNIQFTSSAGLNWRMCDDWTIEYRFQHTSNMGLENQNPGFEMHTLGLSHCF